MSQIRCVSIVGDSNIKRHMNQNNMRDRPLMSGSQLIQCGRLSLFSASLKSIKAEADVCILSCVTNFLTGTTSGSSSSVSLRVESVIGDFLSKICEVAGSRPEICFLICPPMYRQSPIWYREGLPEVLQKFSDLMKNKPPNCHLMPSFPTPSFEDDGIHLTAYSGFEFVLHMFDSMFAVIEKLSMPQEVLTVAAAESSRVLEDRVMVLEQDHRRLNQKFEIKVAVDAELSDFQENIRNEPFLMVMGFVQNSTGRGKDAKTTYRVKMPSAALSKEIRDTFGAFFTGGAKPPPPLKGISIRNAVTTATLARINILQLLAKRYHASNPGSKTHVVGYDPRPLLKLIPPPTATDKSPRVQTYNFIEAVTTLPVAFTSEEISELLKRISPKLHGNLKPLLVVVSDDLVKKNPPTRSAPKGKSASKGKSAPKGASGAVSGSESSSSSKSPGSGTSRKRGASESPSGSAAKK